MLRAVSNGRRLLHCSDSLQSGRQGRARVPGGMVGEVLHGVAGLVVMDRAVRVVVMVRGTDEMVDLVSDIVGHFRRAHPALHRKAMQREKQHEENANDTAHVS